MLIDRSFQLIETAAFSRGPSVPPAARRDGTSASKWAQGRGDSPIVAIATMVLFVMTSLLATATLVPALV